MVQNNVLYAFVAAKAQTDLPATATRVEDLTSQNVGIVDPDGNLILTSETLTAGVDYRIVRRNPLSGKLEYSFFFKPADVISKVTSGYSADTQFEGYLGYNGSTGDLVAVSDTVYTPKLVVKDCLTTYGNKSMMKEAVYKASSAASPLKSDVAIGLANSFAANMLREPEQYVRVAAITSATGTAVTTTGTDSAFSFTIGSATVTAAGTNLAASGLVVGSVIQAPSGAVYKIATISLGTTTGTIGLTQPAIATEATVEGTTQLVDLSADLENADGAWGLKFVGQARTNFDPGLMRYMVYDFDILQGANMDDVLVTYTTRGPKGMNTYEGVTESEWFAQGNRGYGDRIDAIPVKTQVTTESSGADYNQLYLRFRLAQFDNLVGQTPVSTGEIRVYGVAGLISNLLAAFA